MKIGIIGVGNIGGPLTRKLVAAGHDVRVANSRGVEGVRAFAESAGAKPVDVHGAVDGVDVVILSIPLPAVAKLEPGLFAKLPNDVPIVDTGNYYPDWRDPRIPELDADQSESEWVAAQIGRPVIKAFNNILAKSLAELSKPVGAPGRLGVAVAGDDPETKQIVMDLVNQVGFDPVDTGALAESWRHQPSTPGYCCNFDAETMRRGVAAAVQGEAPAKRDAMSKLIVSSPHKLSYDELLELNLEWNAIP
ncbi:MAG: NADPH-dependent F420 reductase [Solirubrobacteraceae bacterium]